MDSVLVRNSDTMRFTNLPFPRFVHETHQYLNATIRTVYVATWTADRRFNLGFRCLGKLRNSNEATIVFRGEIFTLTKTLFTHMHPKGHEGGEAVSIPRG